MNWRNRPLRKLSEAAKPKPAGGPPDDRKPETLDSKLVDAFEQAKLNTEGMAADAYKGPPREAPSLEKLSEKVSLPAVDTARVLARAFPDAAERITSTWLGRHWADVTVAAFAAVVLAALLWVPVRAWVAGAGPTIPKPKVIATRAIPAGAQVKETDLKVSGTGAASAGAVAAAFAGSYASAPIPQGAEIRPGMLGAQPMPGRLLTLPVQHMPALGDRKLPLEAQLVFSSRNAPGGAVFKVTLLDASPAGQSATVTFRMPEKDLPEAAKWIGASDATISFREP